MAKATTNAALVTELAATGVATITLNRPQAHNVLDAELAARLRREIAGLDRDPTVRVIVLTAEGGSFSGAPDAAWLARIAGLDRAQNRDDAEVLGALLKTLYRATKPTIAVVQGAAESTGVGLVAASDLAIAADTATFRLADARLGLIPAPSGPYLVAALGARRTRRYMLTGETMDAGTAQALGLVHEVVPAAGLAAATEALIAQLLQGGPRALAEVKNLVSYVTASTVRDEKILSDTAGHLARVRVSAEGHAGMAAALAGRPPPWDRR